MFIARRKILPSYCRMRVENAVASPCRARLTSSSSARTSSGTSAAAANGKLSVAILRDFLLSHGFDGDANAGEYPQEPAQAVWRIIPLFGCGNLTEVSVTCGIRDVPSSSAPAKYTALFRGRAAPH